MTQNEKKQRVAKAALKYIEDDMIVGVGTGSTVNFFIEYLATIKHRIEGTVASSVATETLLKNHQIPLINLNSTGGLSIYIDGADEATKHLSLIKGGSGALTREKIIAAASEQFVCITDDSKLVDILGKFPLPIEVVPMAQSYVAREIVKLGGQPRLREGFTSDNGNIILDVHNLRIQQPAELEQTINNISGVFTNGLFARRRADVLLLGDDDSVQTII